MMGTSWLSMALLAVSFTTTDAQTYNYLFDNARTQTEAGGRYAATTDLCHGATVWKLNDRDNVSSTPEDVYYMLRHETLDYWVVTRHMDCHTTDWVIRALLPVSNTTAYDASHTEPANMEWCRNVFGQWMIEPAIRVDTRGCETSTGCMQLHCINPDDDKVCADCELNGAEIDCTGGSKDRFIVMIVIFCFIGLVFVGAMAFVLKDKIAEFYKYKRDVPGKMMKVGHTISVYRWFFCGGTLLAAIVFACSGLPYAEVEDNGDFSSEWAPIGGRLESELNFMDEWTEDSKQRSSAAIMVGNSDGSNAYTVATALNKLRVLKEVEKVTVESTRINGSTVTLGMHDFCTSLDFHANKGSPCFVPSILDCFLEGSWLIDYSTELFLSPVTNYGNWSSHHQKYAALVQIVTLGLRLPETLAHYQLNPSLIGMNQSDFEARVNGYPNQCYMWLKTITRSRGYVVGSPTVNENNEITSAETLNSLMFMYSPDRAMEYKVGLAGMSERKVDEALQDWYAAASDRLEEINDDEDEWANVEVSIFYSSLPKKMFAEISKARVLQLVLGCVIILVVAVFAGFSFEYEKSLARASFIGVFFVIISNLGAYGFIALIDIKLNHAMLQALPFLALGLGVDDMFLLLHYYREVPNKTAAGFKTDDIMGELYREGGVSVTLTSVCNASAFFTGMILPIPALRDFMCGAGVIVVFNYAIMFMAFPAIIAWECDNLKKIAADKQEKKAQEAEAVAGDEDEKEKKDEDAEKEEEAKSGGVLGAIKGFGLDTCFLQPYFIPLMQNRITQIVGVALAMCLFIWAVVSLSVIYPLTFGLDMTDLTPRGSYTSKGFSDYDTHLLSQKQEHWYFFRGEVLDMDDRISQFKFQQFYELMSTNKWTNDTGYSTLSKLFLHTFYGTYISTARPGTMNPNGVTWDQSGTIPQASGTHHHYPNLYFANYTNGSQPLTKFHQWRDPVASPFLSSTSQYSDGFGFTFGQDSYDKNNQMEMLYVPYSLDKTLFNSTDDWIDHVEDFRDMADEFFGDDMAFPLPSRDYLTVQEFFSLKKYFVQSFIVSSVVVFCCCLLLAVSMKGALLITFCSVCGTLEVAAFIMSIGLSFSSLVAVTLLMSIGIFVEFSAHVVVGFETFVGSRNERIANCIEKTFIPVLEGGVSSLLSFCMLALSEFPYVFKYFFAVFATVVVVGLLNGLFLLPAMMSLIGTDHDHHVKGNGSEEALKEGDDEEGQKEVVDANKDDEAAPKPTTNAPYAEEGEMEVKKDEADV